MVQKIKKWTNKSRNRQRLKYMVADAISAEIVWMLFLGFRWLVYDGHAFSYTDILVPMFNFYTPLLLYPLGCLLVHYLSGYYIRPLQRSLPLEFLTTFVASGIIALASFFAIIIDDHADNYQRYIYSLIVLFVLQLVVSYPPRLLITLKMRSRMRHDHFSCKTAIIGTGKKAQEVALELQKNPYDPKFIGFIQVDNQEVAEGITPLGNFDDFERLKREFAIDNVVIALEKDVSETDIYAIINQLYAYDVSIQCMPRTYDLVVGGARIQHLNTIPLVNITQLNMPDWEISVKRAFDACTAAVALVLLSPIIAVCAIAIKCTSEGPVFYRQERIGLHKRPFKIIKLRSMYINSEDDKPQLSAKDDKRITPIGRVMRKYRIDEIPQFWNILVGDMSLVGPRPERQFFIDQIAQRAPYYCLVYKLRPGLTSWGPIKVGYTDTLDKMVERLNYDIVYIENMSLLMDLKIMVYTIGVVLGGKGQ